MNINSILREIKDYSRLNDIKECKKLKGGTLSKIFYISDYNNNKYIVKINKPTVLYAEIHFLNEYKENHRLVNILYVGKKFRFYVYTYIEGFSKNLYDKKTYMKYILTNLINHYKIVPNNSKWGWLEKPSGSWSNFLQVWENDVARNLNGLINKSELKILRNLSRSSKRIYSNEAFLLHGDCGVHNLIFGKNRIKGIIDPMPVIGYPFYDLLYAYCSTPDDLDEQIIENISREVTVGPIITGELLREEMLLALFFRLGRCKKHHPQDFYRYLDYIYYWKRL